MKKAPSRMFEFIQSSRQEHIEPTPLPYYLSPLKLWRVRGINAIRSIFGLLWLINAWFAWQPGFLTGITGHAVEMLPEQPFLMANWTRLWLDLLNLNPSLFSWLIALLETSIGLGLLLGAFTNLACVVGLFLSLFLWSTAEGLVLPYDTVSLGASLTYALVFCGLILGNAGYPLGLDRTISPKLGIFYFLASGPEKPAHKRKNKIYIHQGILQDPYNQIFWLPPRGSDQIKTQNLPVAHSLTSDVTTSEARSNTNTQSRLNAIRGQRLSPMKNSSNGPKKPIKQFR
ncbi:hypothetical protein [Ktedonospora formicarum]|uniref:DoxX family protein n=1 Tax=Ktedonospora formicarum TaxID=2778364 RepID=A0A8J3I862_9CHLR|nr:hypothetical protein [Ktedonospora formicarum]GHO46464.1 hypothetical protein KSX_46270 [Ktedonospora formicarum]